MITKVQKLATIAFCNEPSNVQSGHEQYIQFFARGYCFCNTQLKVIIAYI